MCKDEEDRNSYKHHCQWCDYLNWEWVLITLAWSYQWLVVHLGFELTASCSADLHSHNWRAVGDDQIFCRNSIFFLYMTNWQICFTFQFHDWLIAISTYFLPQVFTANSESQKVVKNTFPVPISARHVRVYPMRFNYNICLRMELYGCSNRKLYFELFWF